MNHDQEAATRYPRGRGYGHDYMRGGEVLGGYGYSSREEYCRPRGESGSFQTLDSPDENLVDADSVQPLDTASEFSAVRAERPRPGGSKDSPPPVPEIENAFGISGAAPHSRSYYVTQAQLQQRLYGPRVWNR